MITYVPQITRDTMAGSRTLSFLRENASDFGSMEFLHRPALEDDQVA